MLGCFSCLLHHDQNINKKTPSIYVTCLYGVAITIFLYGAVLSGSRASSIAITIGLTIFLSREAWFRLRWSKVTLTFVGLGLVGISLVYFVLTTGDINLSGRIFNWNDLKYGDIDRLEGFQNFIDPFYLAPEGFGVTGSAMSRFGTISLRSNEFFILLFVVEYGVFVLLIWTMVINYLVNYTSVSLANFFPILVIASTQITLSTPSIWALFIFLLWCSTVGKSVNRIDN